MKNNNIIFIWPPFIASEILPLGIPSLVSYLRNKGVDGCEVFDLNMAYLKKEMQPHWSFYMMMKRGEEVLRKTSIDPSSPLLKFIQERIEEVIKNIEASGKRSIPWSLLSFLDSWRPGVNLAEKRGVSFLLKGVIESRPELLCISAKYTEQLFFALLIAEKVKMCTGWWIF
jgi:hypothetical protein